MDPGANQTSIMGVGQRTYVYVICSPHAHVGTTLTARLLVDFFLSQARPAHGFDTNHLDPALAGVFPSAIQVIDLATTRGQMMLFDQLIEDDKTSKVIDLWHVSYERFFKQAVEIGFFAEARARGLKCFILLLTDPKERFVLEVGLLSLHGPGADVVLVQNEGFHDSNTAAIRGHIVRSGQRPLVIPRLDQPILQLLAQPEILICRFIGVPVPEEIRALQQRLSDLVLPVFNQFELLEVASELNLPARSLLSRQRHRLS